MSYHYGDLALCRWSRGSDQKTHFCLVQVTRVDESERWVEPYLWVAVVTPQPSAARGAQLVVVPGTLAPCPPFYLYVDA